MNDMVVPYITEINHLVGVSNAPDIKNVTISSNTSLPSTQDGEMVTLFAKNLTVAAGATLTVSNRCKGLRVICFGDCKVYGTISMTARGAYAAGQDVTIDIATQTLFSVKFPSEMRLIERYLKNFFNPASTFDDLPTSIRPSLTRTAITGKTIGTVPAAGASGAAGKSSNLVGGTGSAGTGRMCGGGGSGGNSGSLGTSGAGAAGTSFSGGAGGGAKAVAAEVTAPSGSSNGGPGGAAYSGSSWPAGGGAGNNGGNGAAGGSAGGNGTGGMLILIVIGNLAIYSGGAIEAKGVAGGNVTGNYSAGGGGSGGGSVNIAYTGTYSNAGTVTAAGGAGGTASGTSAKAGGAGGAGCVTVEQISI